MKRIRTFSGTLALAALAASCGQSYDGTSSPLSTNSATPATTATQSPGDVVDPHFVKDQFQVTMGSGRQVDVLLVLDNSGSMYQEQQNVIKSLGSFINGFASRAVDYHIGLLSTDAREDPKAWDRVSPAHSDNAYGWYYDNAYKDYPNNGAGSLLARDGNARFLTSQMAPADVIKQFEDDVTLPLWGAGAETGLLSIMKALTSPQLDTWNAGFLRSDAVLATIIVSDEDESHDPDNNPDGYEPYLRSYPDEEQSRIDAYLSLMKTLKPNRPDRVHYNAVIAPSIAECPTTEYETGGTGEYQNGVAGIGVVYSAVASLLGGRVTNICTDFSADLGNMSNEIATNPERVFGLSNRVEDCLSVTLNGLKIAEDTTSGWSYDPDTNQVTIHGLGLENLPQYLVEASYVTTENNPSFQVSSVRARSLASTPRSQRTHWSCSK